jgi:hypothetical protein
MTKPKNGVAGKNGAHQQRKDEEPLGPTFERELACRLTAEEMIRKGTEELALRDQAAEIEQEIKERNKPAKKEIRGHLAKADALRTQRTGREEWRKVRCAERPNYRRGLVEVVRLDTMAVHETRPMTASERQQGFPWAPRKEPGVSAKGAPRKAAPRALVPLPAPETAAEVPAEPA